MIWLRFGFELKLQKMLLLQNSPRNHGCFASSCAAPTTALSPDVFAQVDKHTADILLTGNSTATLGNKFRYCWQAKLNVELATTSLPLFSIQQHGGQTVLPPSFGRFYVLLSVLSDILRMVNFLLWSTDCCCFLCTHSIPLSSLQIRPKWVYTP